VDVDLLIAGAGPAGLATALYAQRAGLRCLVADPRAVPIDKACGEGIMPGAAAALRLLGVPLDGRPFHGIRYVTPGFAAEARFTGGPGVGVRRTALQSAMAEAVMSAGIEIRGHPVTAFRQLPDGVVAGDIRARYLVAADGLHSPIRRRLGMDPAPGPAGSRRWGLRCHIRVPAWTDLVEVHWARARHARDGAEAYVTPVADDCVGVALLSTRRAGFAQQLADFPLLSRRLARAELGTVLGAGPLRCRVAGRRCGRVLLVGDAAGYVDALTGEGIGVAVRTARALVECVVADQVERYDAAWRAESRRYRAVTGALLGASSVPLLRRAIVPAAAALPAVFSGTVQLLAGA
jgi:flavin-dependent dehydrogenase